MQEALSSILFTARKESKSMGSIKEPAYGESDREKGGHQNTNWLLGALASSGS